MARSLIYLFPAVADVIVAAALFVCSNRLADSGQSRIQVALVFAAWAGVYILANQLLARRVTSRNAAAMMITANLMFTAISGVFVCLESLWAIYAAMSVLAVATALFFLPFQVFMKAVEPDPHLGVVRSTALYTFSWSMGYAVGPFVAGFIYQWFGWRWCFAFIAVLGLLIAAGVQRLKHHARHHNPIQVTPPAQIAEMNYHAMPDLAWLGWLVGGVGCLGIFSFLSLLPSVGVFFSIPKSHIGSITASLYAVQATVGLALIRGKTWMYRPWPAAAFAGCGLLGLVCFGLSLLPTSEGVRLAGLYSSVVFYGVFSGSFFFALVFYSLVHPLRSARYLAFNETIVGISGVAGPVMAGFFAQKIGFWVFPVEQFVIMAGVVVLQFSFLKRIHSK